MILTMSPSHIYTDETGAVWPNVTSILKQASLVDDRFFNDSARERGKDVHLATALYDNDDLDDGSISDTIRPYLDGWIKFRRESGFVPGMIEQIIHNEIHRYGGTLDRTGRMNGKQYLIDIKSGTVQPATALQTMAYSECLEDHYKRGAVELHANGTYKIIEYKNDRQDRSVWYAALVLRNWKINKGVK